MFNERKSSASNNASKQREHNTSGKSRKEMASLSIPSMEKKTMHESNAGATRASTLKTTARPDIGGLTLAATAKWSMCNRYRRWPMLPLTHTRF